MKLSRPYSLAAAAGLWLSSLGFAQEPARLPVGSPSTPNAVSADQGLADQVAERLAQAPNLRGYQVDIAVVNGLVQLTGATADANIHDALLRIVGSVPGVVQVRDGLTVINGIRTVSDQGQLPAPIPLGAGLVPAPMPGALGMTPTIDPMPMGGAGPMSTMAPPNMPPHAWPTYAPYNNYSRVAYPEQYPAAAFPFIGPFYPFPKVPLGYRAIKLEWEDGHWFYGRTAVRRDFWTVRYW